MATYNNKPFIPYERRMVIYEGTGMWRCIDGWDLDHPFFMVNANGDVYHGDEYETAPYPPIGYYNWVAASEGPAFVVGHYDVHGTANFHQLARGSRDAHMYNALVLEVQTFFKEDIEGVQHGSFRYDSSNSFSRIGLALPGDLNLDPDLCHFIGLCKLWEGEEDGYEYYAFAAFHPLFTTSPIVVDVTDDIVESGDGEFKLQLITIVLRPGFADLYIDRRLSATIEVGTFADWFAPYFFAPNMRDAITPWTYFSFYYKYLVTRQGYGRVGNISSAPVRRSGPAACGD